MAKEKSSEARIIEERVEFMVDHTSSKVIQNPTKRIAHFLNPSLNPNAVPPSLPKIQSFSSSSKPNVVFHCTSIPLKGWQTWVENLRGTHEPVWRKAGIFDAIKCSTYPIDRVDGLILSLVEKWCPDTNTFVFPWGEATVTLEDVYVLGGFSPLGVSVSSSSLSLGKDVELVKKKLIESYRKLTKNIPNLSQLRWQEHFMGCGNQLENAGFLALWLARHVFAGKSTAIVPQAVLSMAARLSCGDKLAFGPVILASIYRDLTLLKRKIVGSLSGRSLRLTSPLYLVQVWAWERFPSLGPVPRMINCGEIRLARWASQERKLYDDIDDMEMCLDSSRETFRWRPYTMSLANWSLPRFYVDAGKWVDVDSHKDWKLFARCLVVGQLVGLKNCVEGYNPHRVALQFGFDQDIPKSVDLSKSTYTLDDIGYMMDFKSLKLYLPPRLHEGDITSRYFDWWRTRLDEQEVALVGFKRKLRTGKRVKKIAKSFDTSNELKAIIVANVGENSVEKLPPRDEFSPKLLQVGNGIGMEEDDEDEQWTTKCSMSECSKTNISGSKLAEIELHRGIDQEEGGVELAEMLLERKQGCDAMNSLCSQFASKHQYLEANIPQNETPTESNGTLIRVACKDESDTNHGNIPVNSHVATSLIVMDKSDQKSFAASCLEYESRMSRLERVISALSVYKPT